MSVAKQWLSAWLESVWYDHRPLARLSLSPLSYVFCYLAQQRKAKLSLEQQQFPVPVLVVGNITVGGTGKTPLVIWLIEHLRAAGYRPGVVSRGFGGKQTAVHLVQAQDQAFEVGDEPVVIVQRTAVPLVIGRDRPAAIAHLLAKTDCNLVISDDGLQHYRMARDLEIVVLDGARRFGNGYCLPAGPLREKPVRLQACDFVVTNGQAQQGEYTLQILGKNLQSLVGAEQRALSLFQGQSVHAVTGIGNPARFFSHLTSAGLSLLEHVFPDHHAFTAKNLSFQDNLPILMTEKDAVKCRNFPADIIKNAWYLPIEAQLDTAFAEHLLQRLKELTVHG
ncbi:tetraacyldisaccharide 4'-kinase [Thiothrix eikelboomii]|uniref:tetraacyldisaccharide 4'-kinase n=1 Tax=Thiothrix eikelboomii TaxID=92487 RepID=UPI003BB13E8C